MVGAGRISAEHSVRRANRVVRSGCDDTGVVNELLRADDLDAMEIRMGGIDEDISIRDAGVRCNRGG